MSGNPIDYVHEASDVLTRSNYQPTLIGSYQYPGIPNTLFDVHFREDNSPSITSGAFSSMTVMEGCTRVRADGTDQSNELYASVYDLIPQSIRIIPDPARMTEKDNVLSCYATCEYVRQKSCQTFTTEVIRLYNSPNLPMLLSMNVSDEEKVRISQVLSHLWVALNKAIGSLADPAPTVGSTEAWITERLLLAIRKNARLMPTVIGGRHALGSATSQKHLAGLKEFYQQELVKASTVGHLDLGMHVVS